MHIMRCMRVVDEVARCIRQSVRHEAVNVGHAILSGNERGGNGKQMFGFQSIRSCCLPLVALYRTFTPPLALLFRRLRSTLGTSHDVCLGVT